MTFQTPTGTRGGKVPHGAFMRLVNRLMVRKARRSESASMGPMRLLVLTTTGAKSGQRRETPVGWFDGGDGTWLVVASANGAQKNPAWFHNIAAHPDDVTIEIGGRTIPVVPEQLHGADREQALAGIVAESPNFGKYKEKTDREIPVLRLRERSTGPA